MLKLKNTCSLKLESHAVEVFGMSEEYIKVQHLIFERISLFPLHLYEVKASLQPGNLLFDAFQINSYLAPIHHINISYYAEYFLVEKQKCNVYLTWQPRPYMSQVT